MSSPRELHFSMSYDELINLSYEKETYFTRDVANLTSRGITAARIAGIDTLRKAFLAVPTDTVMLGQIKIANTDRDTAMVPVIALIREIIGMAKNTFGINSGEYKTFGSTDLSRLDAGGLVRLGTTVGQQAGAYLTQMTPHGLTAATITELETLTNALPPLIREVDKTTGNQLLTTVDRHNKANALYDEISAMCSTAVVYYTDRNPVKAADYVIYDTSGSMQQRNGDVAANSIVTRDLKGVAANSQFSLRVNEGSSLVFFFSKTEAGVAGSKSITVANNPNNFETHTAADLGYDSSTGFIYFCIQNPSVDEVGNYSVKVE
jgi:hypothetical protein